jgi:hypothetical protein
VVSLVGGVLIGHFWIVARKNTADEILAVGDRRVNLPAVIGFLAGIAIAVPLVIFAPDIPSVIGGLIGGIVVYPIVAKVTGHYEKGRLTLKGIGTSTENYIKYDDSVKATTNPPDSLNPSESSTKEVNKTQDSTTTIDKEDKNE